MSIRYQHSLARAIAYSATLTADDPRFAWHVEVRHVDGSLWYLRNAFHMAEQDTLGVPPEDRGKYVWVITEHFGELVFEAEEVTIKTFPAGPCRDYLARESHDEGIDNPALVQCQCAECNGHFFVDGTNRDRSRAFLACDVCKCTYFAPVEKL